MKALFGYTWWFRLRKNLACMLHRHEWMGGYWTPELWCRWCDKRR